MTPIHGWEINRLAAALGAEVRGVQLADADADIAQQVQDLLNEHQVLFFPDQTIDVDQHVAFGRHFGHLEGHPNLASNSELPPEIFELRASSGGIADEWHTDLTFQEQPALMSILHMVQCPEVGGDTMWAHLGRAYDDLSEPMKTLCDGLTALHDALPHNRPDRMTIHPVVRTHPDTGEKMLYVSEHFTRRIAEMNATESDMLLRYLTDWISQPRFTVRYNWQPNTIAIWDNRATQHFVLNDFNGERISRRVTVQGDEVTGVGAPHWPTWTEQGRRTAASRHDRQLALYLRDKLRDPGTRPENH